MKGGKSKSYTSKKTNDYKITSPINHPANRSIKGNVPIPSETDVERARNWTKINRL